MNKISKKIISSILLTSMVCYTTPIFAFTKDETVYSKMDASGKQYKTIVSTRLENEDKLKTINDFTNLFNIENVNGDETFKQDGKSIVWDANGNDIFYQGESKEELPISVEIKYELNGKETEPKEIAGKSGEVKITIIYTNNDEHTVNVNGINTKMYTPFAVVGGTIINNKNKIKSVNNAKVINDGTRSIVAGVFFPGLEESLNLSSSKLNIPTQMVITVDAKDFEMSEIVTFATPKLISDDNSNIIDEVKEISNKVELIKDSTNALKDGADKLKSGTEEYSENAKLFNSKMKELSSGVNTMNSQYALINSGISDVNVGVGQLQGGVLELQNGVPQLQNGLTTISQNLNGICSEEDGALTQINAGLGQITAALDSKAATTDVDNIDALIAGNTALKASLEQTGDEQTAALIAGNIAVLNNLKASLVDTQNMNTNLKTINANIEKVNDGISSLKTGVDTINTKLNDVNYGLGRMSYGLDGLADGTSKLEYGSYKMQEGLNTLDSSTTQLTTANTALTDASVTISDGATQLSDGMTKFNTEINKYLSGDLAQISSRVENLVKLSKQYKTFSETNNEINGRTKFILMTDKLKKEE